ncbi:MAG: putative ABC transport system permease protein [Gammaproteobacteria bacterium]|jgi:putative ABC transport system permease protein
MRITDQLRFALNASMHQRLRSALTVLGIAVGITAVVLLTAVGEGVRAFVLAEFTQFGTNIIAITPGKVTTLGISGATISSVRPLTVRDAQALRRIGALEAVVPVIQGNAEVEHERHRRRTTVIGVGPEMPEVWRMGLAAGAFLPDDRFERARSFAVLGSKLHTELFAGRNALNARIRIGGERFRVVGIMASKGQLLGFDLDDTVFIPVAKSSEMFNREGLMEIDVTYRPGESSSMVVAELKRVLKLRHGQEDFTVTTQGQMLEVLGDVLDVLTAGVAAIGAISLIVGAFGILTVMTIAVSERTSEVGLLRALGARRREILVLFLGEATALGVIGGLVGVLFGTSVVGLVSLVLPNLPLEVSWPYVGAGLALSFIVGGVAGVWPASRAAGTDPVEAMRAQ